MDDDRQGRPIEMAHAELAQIFADGFESGDTSAWSMTVPWQPVAALQQVVRQGWP